MTFKEKLMKEDPDLVSDTFKGGVMGCPFVHGYCSPKRAKCERGTETTEELCRECWNQKAGPSAWQIILIIGGVLALLIGLIGFGMHVFAAEPDRTPIDISVVDALKRPSTDKPVESAVEPVVEETVEESCDESCDEPSTDVATEPVVPAVRYFNVPLSEDLQNHIFAVCERYRVDPAIVIAVIQKESRYNAGVIGDNGNSFGLMQIQPRWHSARMAKLGCTDLLDPYQNVTVGIDILAELFGMGGSLDWVLMSYNGGYGHANDHIAAGTISDYAATVKYYMNTIERK